MTDAIFTSSNVTEADYGVYSAATTYALNAYVIVTTGVHKIYQSLVASNLGNAVTDITKWLDSGLRINGKCTISRCNRKRRMQ